MQKRSETENLDLDQLKSVVDSQKREIKNHEEVIAKPVAKRQVHFADEPAKPNDLVKPEPLDVIKPTASPVYQPNYELPPASPIYQCDQMLGPQSPQYISNVVQPGEIAAQVQI